MTYGRAPWLVELDRRTVAEVAAPLGVGLVRRAHGNDTFPCPACGSEKRHRKAGDKRGAIDVRDDKPRVWYCRQCEAGGDVLDFVAFVLVGRKASECSSAELGELERWTRDHFHVSESASPGGARRPSKEQREHARLVSSLSAPRVEPSRPEAAEVLDVWTSGRPVTDDAGAREWLASRGIDADMVAALDLARVMPTDAPMPPWAVTSKGSTYPAAGWRLAFPMFDGAAELRSLRWRRTDDRTPKTLASSCSRLVLADPVGRVMLAGRMAELPDAGGVVVLEGETDLAFVACRDVKIHGLRPAFLGVVQGSASREWTTRIPDGWLGIATDDDEQGDRYASEVFALVAHRVRLGRLRVERWRPNVPGLDVSEAGGLENGRWEPMVAAATTEGIAR